MKLGTSALFLVMTSVVSCKCVDEELFPDLDSPAANGDLCFWECSFPDDCRYGEEVAVSCVLSRACHRTKQMKKTVAVCQYCYQTDPYVHKCEEIRNCSVTASPPKRLVRTVCEVSKETPCLGNRRFYKRVPCNWTSGYKWSTAFILRSTLSGMQLLCEWRELCKLAFVFSVTLGGFGADRFYLGLWQSGLGKLFSFGGLGVWTLIDVVLVGVGYIGPADGSVYMNL